eukprot:795459-Prorocentrum_minimum.AAC.1
MATSRGQRGTRTPRRPKRLLVNYLGMRAESKQQKATMVRLAGTERLDIVVRYRIVRRRRAYTPRDPGKVGGYAIPGRLEKGVGCVPGVRRRR